MFVFYMFKKGYLKMWCKSKKMIMDKI